MDIDRVIYSSSSTHRLDSGAISDGTITIGYVMRDLGLAHARNCTKWPNLKAKSVLRVEIGTQI